MKSNNIKFISPYEPSQNPEHMRFFEYCSKVSKNIIEIFKIEPETIKLIDIVLFDLISDNKNWLTDNSDKTRNIHRIHVYVELMYDSGSEKLQKIHAKFEEFYQKVSV